ncbi:MAG: hypothetical protein FD147_1948 [Chloroflexi bacterium]|nr:MAG: hypothetical protein FD147_1948 [Chloroflexota bacterium]
MTPDTSSYMIAGFIVILGGIAGYIFTLIFRNRKIMKKLNLLEDRNSEKK